jgi:four helix bundle protein
VKQEDRRQSKADLLADSKHSPYYPSSAPDKRGATMASTAIRTYKDLWVWQKAIDLSVEVYRLTRSFPSHERYGLTAETRKTSRSVPYNIAEGHKRGSTAEYIRFLGIAAGSAAELETQLLLAGRLGYLKGNTAEAVLALHAEVEMMLDSLIRSLKAKIDLRP